MQRQLSPSQLMERRAFHIGAAARAPSGERAASSALLCPGRSAEMSGRRAAIRAGSCYCRYCAPRARAPQAAGELLYAVAGPLAGGVSFCDTGVTPAPCHCPAGCQSDGCVVRVSRRCAQWVLYVNALPFSLHDCPLQEFACREAAGSFSAPVCLARLSTPGICLS